MHLLAPPPLILSSLFTISKNLGPGVMQQEVYTKEVLQYHFDNKAETYHCIHLHKVTTHLEAIHYEMDKIVSGGKIPPEEALYFTYNILHSSYHTQ